MLESEPRSTRREKGGKQGKTIEPMSSRRSRHRPVGVREKAAQLAKEQARTVHRMAEIISSSNGSEDDAPHAADGYTVGYSRIGDRKGKGPTRKCRCPGAALRLCFSFYLCCRR